MVHNLTNAANSGKSGGNRKLKIGLIVIVSAAVAAGLAFTGIKMYANSLPEADAKLSASGAAGASIKAADATGDWKVASGSEAGYRVGEVLAGKHVVVTGRTSEVSGNVTVANAEITEAEIKVDLRNVKTDDSSRDGQFRNLVIDTSANPAATFKVSQAVKIPDLGATAQTVPVTGELTIKGKTKSVSANLKVAAKSSSQVSISVEIPLVWSDFGVVPPDLGFVKVETNGSIEALVSLTK